MTEVIERPIALIAPEDLPTIVHVEDDPDWHDEVRNVLRTSQVPMRDVIPVETVDNFRDAINGFSGPLVLIVDLDLRGESEDPRYSGFNWMVDEMPSYLRRHASIIVFVLSGHLDQSNTLAEALNQRGVPQVRQLSKMGWPENSGSFVAQIREFVEHVDETALHHFAEGVSASKMDPHLLHAVSAATRTDRKYQTRFTLLVRVRNPETWNGATIPDLAVATHVGDVFVVSGTVHSVVALERSADVLRVEYSRPCGGVECDRSIPFIKADVIHSTLPEKGDQCLVGLVDTGFDVCHPAFLNENGKPRIVSLWDQRDPSGPHFEGIGTVHTAEMIEAYCQAKMLPASLKSYDLLHGTHVASIAAGRSVGPFTGGVAPAARIAMVIADFETKAGKPESIGYSASHALALQFLKNEAKSLSLPLVVNISEGMNAGAHDGSSMLEKLLDGAITGGGGEEGIVVIKSAGNERTTNRHARVRMISKSREVIRWHSEATERLQDSLELWCDAGDRISLQITDPRRQQSKWVHVDNPADSGSLSGVAYDMTFIERDDDNGLTRCTVTLTANVAGRITSGIWRLEIRAKDIFSGDIDVWLERENQNSTRFLDSISEEMTLTIPGTSKFVITVGCAETANPLKLAPDSSFGRTRDGREKPELSAPGDPVTAAYGGTQGTISQRGSSHAAPHVAGAVALLMSQRAKQHAANPKKAQFNSAQIQMGLMRLVQDRGNKWHPGLGFGMLDVEALVRDMTK